ncbi:hypothetical protein Tco_0701039 [Tanacetum coccineum]
MCLANLVILRRSRSAFCRPRPQWMLPKVSLPEILHPQWISFPFDVYLRQCVSEYSNLCGRVSRILVVAIEEKQLVGWRAQKLALLSSVCLLGSVKTCTDESSAVFNLIFRGALIQSSASVLAALCDQEIHVFFVNRANLANSEIYCYALSLLQISLFSYSRELQKVFPV